MANTKKKKVKFKLNNFLILLCILSSIYLTYYILELGPIEPLIRYIIIGVIILINILFFKKKKKINKKLAGLMMILFIIFNVLIAMIVGRVYNAIDHINKSKIVYSASIVTKKNSKIKSIDDIDNLKLGMINDVLSIDNYTIAKEIVDDNSLESDNEIIEYEEVLNLIKALYNDEVDAILISSNYANMFKTTEGYENIDQDLKTIYTQDKTVAKNDSTGNKKVTKPFTILLMGIDSELDNLQKNSYSNGDSLMLLTFNPDTFNTTMMSVPRDSYIPIACKNNEKNKLTHAGWSGTTCMMNTIENYFDIKIDYYVKINFKGVVNLVNALGGVDVEVPRNLCTDDSNRWKKVCIEKGWQHLDGEHALVLARNRYDMPNGVFDRDKNQQKLIKAMLRKLTTIRSVNKFLDILDTVSNNLDTNLSTDEILSFYNIFKEILSTSQKTDSDVLNIEQLKLEGEGKIMFFKQYNMNMWALNLNEDQVKYNTNAMKINLGLKDPDMEKEITFKP